MSRSTICLFVSASGLSALGANTIIADVLGRRAALILPGPVLTGVLVVAAVLWLVYAVVRATDRVMRRIDEVVRDAASRRYAESVGVDLPHRAASNGHLRRVW